MFHRAKWMRLLAISAVVLGLLTVGCIGTVFYHTQQAVRAYSLNMSLAAATLEGNVEEATRLLKEGADPNFVDSWSPLEAAVERDNLAMVKLLLEHGANVRQVNVQGPILFQAQSDVVFNLLLARGADVNARMLFDNRQTILMQAVQNSDAGKVRRLLAHGADPRLTDDSGQSAFDMVSRSEIYSKEGMAEIVSLLTEASKKRSSP